MTAGSMARSLPDTVVFDLDGTLVDSSPDLTAALNVALAAVGRPAVDPATVRTSSAMARAF